MKHTPGPWRVDKRNQVVCAEGLPICPDVMGENPEIYRANAQLIAASPKLLQAAKKMVASLERCDDVWFLAEEWVELEAAIKEAEGNL